MTITIRSAVPELQAIIDKIEADQIVSPIEFIETRSTSDRKVEEVVKAVAAGTPIETPLRAFQVAADEVVEAMQKIILTAKKKKLPRPDSETLAKAVEYQIAYIVMGYKSSVEHLLQDIPSAASSGNLLAFLEAHPIKAK